MKGGYSRRVRKERKKEKKGSLSKTDNEAEDEFTLHVVDNPAFGLMGTVFTQPFRKINVHTR